MIDKNTLKTLEDLKNDPLFRLFIDEETYNKIVAKAKEENSEKSANSSSDIYINDIMNKDEVNKLLFDLRTVESKVSELYELGVDLYSSPIYTGLYTIIVDLLTYMYDSDKAEQIIDVAINRNTISDEALYHSLIA